MGRRESRRIWCAVDFQKANATGSDLMAFRLRLQYSKHFCLSVNMLCLAVKAIVAARWWLKVRLARWKSLVSEMRRKSTLCDDLEFFFSWFSFRLFSHFIAFQASWAGAVVSWRGKSSINEECSLIQHFLWFNCHVLTFRLRSQVPARHLHACCELSWLDPWEARRRVPVSAEEWTKDELLGENYEESDSVIYLDREKIYRAHHLPEVF